MAPHRPSTRPARAEGTRRAARGVFLLVLVTAVAAGATGCTSSVAQGKEGLSLDLDMTSCGSSWALPQGGAVTFTLKNTYSQPLDVYLQNPTTAKVYGELEGVGHGAAISLDVVLGNGSYRFVCTSDGTTPAYGPAAKVTGAAGVKNPTPGVVPVTRNDLAAAANEYQTWVQLRLGTLQQQVQTLAQAVAADDAARAKKAWLTAHLTYETLGAAYELFGDTGDAINGLPASSHTALNDPDLTGFHRIEALLWAGHPLSELTPLVNKLSDDIGSLSVDLLTDPIDQNDIALRAHEIVENVIQFQLDAVDDAGSHTTLATVSASLTGASEALSVLVPILTTRYPALASTQAALAASTKLVNSFHTAAGWTPLQSLSRAQRERLNTSLGGTVDLLAPVAAICDIRNGVQS